MWQQLDVSQYQEKQMHSILDQGLNELKNSTTKKRHQPSVDSKNFSPFRSNNVSELPFMASLQTSQEFPLVRQS